LLLDAWSEDWLETALSTKASTVAIKDEDLTPQRLNLLRGSPVPILAYTIDDPARARELLDNGVKAVYSDNAAAILKGNSLPRKSWGRLG
jgi:glycerophosphoryl diester phosphodiesterase